MSEPSIQFGSSNIFGTFSGWAEQNTSSDLNLQRAAVLGATGNEVASHLYDSKTDYSQPYKATSTGACTLPTIIGALVNSAAILTEISISTTNSDYADMSLTGHQHTVNAHANTLQQATHGISVSTGFGATDFIGGTAGSNAAPASGNITISCSHEDILDADGDHLIGQNYNGHISATTVWNGVPSSTSDGSWDVTTAVTATNNQGFLQTTVTAEKALALA